MFNDFYFLKEREERAETAYLNSLFKLKNMARTNLKKRGTDTPKVASACPKGREVCSALGAMLGGINERTTWANREAPNKP